MFHSEKPDLSSIVFVGLCALVALHAVVQAGAEGVQFQICEGLQEGISPACLSVVVDGDHMVCVQLPEGEVAFTEVGHGQLFLPRLEAQFVGLSFWIFTWKVD